MTTEFLYTTVNRSAVPVGTVLLTDDEAKKRCWHFSDGKCISLLKPTKPCDLVSGKCHRGTPTIKHNNTDTLVSADKH